MNQLYSSNEGKMKSVLYDLIMTSNMIVSQKLLKTKQGSRVAVNETLVFTKEIKERLVAVKPERLANEIKDIMLEKNDTMVSKAEKLFHEGVIDEDVFIPFKNAFSY
jgi:Tfp pilus assembly pilus retraction ATPase PilT